MDAVSGLFLDALGTDMVTMEEYFPFITKAFDVMKYTAWAILFLIIVWQLFRAFGGPITEAENPWQLVVRGAVFALLIGYAKPIFTLALDIARAPYTALMDLSMTAEDFTFAGIEQVLSNGLLTIVSTVTIVGPILVLILLIALGWNYFMPMTIVPSNRYFRRCRSSWTKRACGIQQKAAGQKSTFRSRRIMRRIPSRTRI